MTDALPNAIERGTDICCPHCDAHTPRTRYAGLAGTTVNCESCDRAFIVPDPGPTPLVDDEHSQSGKRFARKPTPWMMLRRAAGSLIGTRLGQVDIVGILGRGGMGTVYVGRHADLDIDVAVKALPEETAADEQLIQRFLREARLAIRLNHPNVVSIYNVGQQDGLYYIVMELVRGSDAAHMMKEGGRFSFRRAIEIGIAATHALEAAHAEGLVHRDMKPHNILISTDGRVKISDFGLARAAAGQSGLTVSGQVMGTPHYMSPEQAETLPIDHRSDIYSLGITLYHMLTGHPPFQGDTPIAVALAHVRRDVPFPADVFSHFPDPLVAVLKRMCAKKPENRFSSAAEVRAALESLLTAAAPETGSDALLPALISEPKAISSREQEIQETVRASRTGSFYGIDRGWSARGNRVVIARRLGKALLLLAMVAGFAGGALFLYREITSDRPGRFSSNNPPATSGGIFSPSSPRNGAPAPLEKLFKDAESLLEGDITATSLDEARATLKAVEALDPSGADAERYLALSLRLESQQFRYGIARKLDEIRSSIAANDLPTAAQSLAAATVLAARAPEALRESAQREIEAARSEALAASDSAFNASLAEARSAVTLGQYSRARSILSNVMPDFLNDGQKAELTAAIATAEQARRDRFDALEAGITKALASSNLDHAHNLLEDAAKLELNENEQQRLAKLQAQVPGRQRTLEASRRLNEAWQAIAASELERAQYKLNGVDENLDHDIAARKSLAEQALVKALVFESAIRQLDIILAHEALMSLKELSFEDGALGAYDLKIANVRRELDRFNTALIEADKDNAQAAIDALRALQVPVIDLEERLRQREKNHPIDDLTMIRSGKWYQVEREFRRFGWSPETGSPPPGASRDVANALTQIGTEAGHIKAGERDYYNSVVPLPDGESILLAKSDGAIELRSTGDFDGPALKSVMIENAYPLLVRAAGDHFLCAMADGKISLFSLESFTAIKSAEAVPADEPTKRISALAVSPDHRLAAVASDDKHIRLFRLPELTPVGDPIPLASPPNAVDISLADDALITCCDDGQFLLYSLSKRELLLNGNPAEQAAHGAVFSPNGTLFAVASGRSVYVYSLRDKRIYREHPRVAKADIRCLRFSPDGTALVLSDTQRELLVVDFETNTVVRQLNGHSKTVIDLAFDASGRFLASCAEDRLAILWKMYGVPLD